MKVYSGGPLDYPQSTLAQMFWKTVRDHAAKPGFRARPAKGAPFDRWTWEQTGARVAEIGNGLLSAGVKPGERVAILSETRVEWSLSDFGIFSAGGVTVTVYPTLTGEQTAYLFNDSEATIVFVEDQKQFDKIVAQADAIRTVRRYVTFSPVNAPGRLAK